MEHKNKAELTHIFNELTTHFLMCATWHQMSALFCLQSGVYRGLARWHFAEAEEDRCHIVSLSKYLVDIKDIVLVQNPEVLRSVYSMPSHTLPQHLAEWEGKEGAFLDVLATTKSKLFALAEHSLFCIVQPLIKEVEDERFAVNRLLKRFHYTDYAPHDVATVMKSLHKYFEHHHEKGKPLNFDI